MAERQTATLRLGAILWSLALAGLFAYLLAYLAHVAVLVRYPFDVDQGEGYDLYSAWLLARGRSIYNDNNVYPYYSSNYPPVYSLVVAPIVAQVGPVLGAGRLVSAGAALLTALLIGAVVYRATSRGLAGLAAGLLYVGSNYVYHVTPLVRVNALATLFALAGVYCCARPGWRPVVAASVAFLLALFTKQTTVDAVVAGVLVVLLRDRRAGLILGAVVGGVGLLLLLALDRAHQGQFVLNVVVGNVNPFSISQAFGYYRNFLEIHAGILLLAGWWAARCWRRRRVGAFEAYWLASLGLAVSVGKWGAGESYFLGSIAATCVLAGCALASFLRLAARRPRVFLVGGTALVVQALLMAHGPVADSLPVLADRGAQAAALGRWPSRSDVEAGSDLVLLLRRQEGPILSEDPAFSLAANGEVVANATHLRNLYQAGVWRPDGLVEDLAARRFSFVVLDAELYPEPVLEAIGRYYYLYEEYGIYGAPQKVFAPGAN